MNGVGYYRCNFRRAGHKGRRVPAHRVVAPRRFKDANANGR